MRYTLYTISQTLVNYIVSIVGVNEDRAIGNLLNLFVTDGSRQMDRRRAAGALLALAACIATTTAGESTDF